MKDKYNHTSAYYSIMILVMYAVTIVLSGTMAFLKKESFGHVIGTILVSIICITVIAFYLTKERVNKVNFTRQLACYRRIVNVYCILYVFLFVMTFLPSLVRPMFVIGIIVTLMTNEYLGILFQVYLSVIMILVMSESVEVLAFYLISGLIGCSIAKYFSQKKNILYAIIILITANLGLYGVVEYLKNDTISTKFIIYSLLGTIGGIAIIAITLPYIYYQVDNRSKTKLMHITDPDYELLAMLKNDSKELYQHSERVAKLSEKVAYKVGADSLLAKAGGFYHKIGKLEGNDFVKRGVEIAQSYSFPQEVVDIIKQHTGRTQAPRSIEAAIVMLSDKIISAFEYLEEKQNGVTYDKNMVIDQVIDSKLNKDMLDESGLSLKMFCDIKKCFKQEENIYDV